MSPAGAVRRPGPGALLLPVATLTLVSAFLILRGGDASGPPFGDDVPGVVVDATVAGLEGSWDAGSGARLHVRVVPLHADAGRQEFERDALAQRLAPGPGAPWLLVLRWEEPASGDGSGAGVALEATKLPLAALEVRAVGGGAGLVPIATAAGAPDGDLHDPLAVLLAPPDEPLRPGQSVEVVLWGEGGVEVLASLWFRLKPGGMAVGPVRGIPLAPAELPRADLPRYLARLDRPPVEARDGREDGRTSPVR